MIETSPRWSDEAVAASFRAEIQARFESHNAAFRAREAIDLETVLREHPEKQGQPGYEVRDSGAWSVYQASEIRIDRNTVTVVLPRGVAIGVDLVHLFAHTTMAWSTPMIGATIVDGEARPTIEIVLVATWNDSMDVAYKADPRNGRRVLCDLHEEDVRVLCALIEAQGISAEQAIGAEDATSSLLYIRDRLKIDLEYLP
jgi:hypothetical protein